MRALEIFLSVMTSAIQAGVRPLLGTAFRKLGHGFVLNPRVSVVGAGVTAGSL
jgi:hypothetical protein